MALYKSVDETAEFHACIVSILTHVSCAAYMLSIARCDKLLHVSEQSFKFGGWSRAEFCQANKHKKTARDTVLPTNTILSIGKLFTSSKHV